MTAFENSSFMPIKHIQVMEDPMVMECKSNRMEKQVENGPQRKSISSIWTDFGDVTSMHGLGRAINGKRLWKKVVWALLVVIAACFAVWNFYEIIDNYNSYPVTTSVTLRSTREMKFPAVTICNLNPTRLSALDIRIQQALNNSVEKDDSAGKQRRIYKKLLNAIYAHGIRSDRKGDIYYTMTDMLVDCEFDLKPCDAKDFEPIASNLYGQCFTFNSDKESPKTIERAGNRNGLILELDIQSSEYLPFVSTSGIRVLVHPQTDVAFPEDNGIVVGPGRATSIGIRQRRVTRQPPPWGSCINVEDAKNPRINMFSDKFDYSSAVCEKTCYQRTVVDECRCCDQSFPCNESALIEIVGLDLEDEEIDECDESNNTVANCLSRVLHNYLSGNLSCPEQCNPSCREISFITNYATGSWPGANFEKTLISKAKKAQRKRKRVLTEYPDPLTSSFVFGNFLRVEVYFESFVQEVVVTNPAYDWSKLLSDIGGQWGLWLGFSIMTGLELIELLFDISTFLLRRIRSANTLRTAPGNVF